MIRTTKRRLARQEANAKKIANHIEHAWDAIEDDDPESAEEEALHALKMDETSADALEVLAAALVDQERYDDALPVIELALTFLPDDASLLVDRGICLVGTYRFQEGEALLAAVSEAHPELPDAYYWRGVARDMRGDLDGAAPFYARAVELDPDCFFAPTRVARDAFDKIVQEAIAELPEEFRTHLHSEVPITVSDFPSAEMARGEEDEESLSPLILGLFVGQAVNEKGVFTSGSLPPMVFLFQRNIERVARTHDEFVEEVRVTLLHEIGHYMGLDEEELAERGLE